MDLIPGDYVEITPSYFSRTQTCNSAAFSRINEHVDYYAVPFRLLWRWWTEFISNVGNTDSAYNPNGTAVPNDLPYINGAEIKVLLSNTPDNLSCWIPATYVSVDQTTIAESLLNCQLYLTTDHFYFDFALIKDVRPGILT